MTFDYPEISPRGIELARTIADLIWQKYDDEHGYQSEKRTRNSQFQAILPIWQQFDYANQSLFQFLVASYAGLTGSQDAKAITDWIVVWQEETHYILNNPE